MQHITTLYKMNLFVMLATETSCLSSNIIPVDTGRLRPVDNLSGPQISNTKPLKIRLVRYAPEARQRRTMDHNIVMWLFDFPAAPHTTTTFMSLTHML